MRQHREAPGAGAVRRILVVAPSWIGDTLMAQPLLARLRASHPQARIDVLAPPWVAPVLSRMPEVDGVIDNPFAHGQFRWRARRALGRTLARAPAASPARGGPVAEVSRTPPGPFDVAYVLPNSWKSALVPWFASIPRRVGYLGEARWGLLTEAHRLDAQRHPRLIQRYAALAGPLPDAPLGDPHIESSAAQQAATRRALSLPVDARPLVLCPGAEYGPAKRWPAAHYAALARRWQDSSRGEAAVDVPSVWLVGSKKDAAVAAEIAAVAPAAVFDLCGKSTLDQAVDLIAGARAVVCNDSGLMHVAAALGVPLLALFGSSSPEYTPPASPRARLLSRRLPCSPCFKRECPLGHLDCLQGLSPDEVFGSLTNWLEELHA